MLHGRLTAIGSTNDASKVVFPRSLASPVSVWKMTLGVNKNAIPLTFKKDSNRFTVWVLNRELANIFVRAWLDSYGDSHIDQNK